MNNIAILLTALAALIIAFFQCFNPEGMTLFFLACLVCIPAILVGLVGIVLNKNFFEC